MCIRDSPYGLYLNCADKLLKNPGIRRGLAHSVNMGMVIDTLSVSYTHLFSSARRASASRACSSGVRTPARNQPPVSSPG